MSVLGTVVRLLFLFFIVRFVFRMIFWITQLFLHKPPRNHSNADRSGTHRSNSSTPSQGDVVDVEFEEIE